ncbi:hypothetical protein QU593_10025 [Rossellomorea marisflavi]|uniref:hypothetical protein n=1 Tax=Rossellomorea marisflavi TaxID=189381 RepID=UPI0025B03226|nr:hypothetical protein [Rossellomorea marisflavi]WJV20741.1 hypothetical protein QU593_10025 [Rossellomorea marisflavi]
MRILSFDEWLEDQDENRTLDDLREEYLRYVERMERKLERRQFKKVERKDKK